ncbi:hypothetical protein [Ralstonia sp. 24A2]|uniref:hypothetical protein n=1 Tax=Ralstonia sp. 24A2 TaxID=3447364 RepID=UPI003F6A0A91
MKKDVASTPQNRQDDAAHNAAFNMPYGTGNQLNQENGWPHLTEAAPFDGGFDTYDNTLPTGSTRAYVAGHWVPLATRPHVADVHALTVYGKDRLAAEQGEVTVASPSPASTSSVLKAADVSQAELPPHISVSQVQDTALPPAEAGVRESNNRPIEAQRLNATRAWSLEQRSALDEILPAATTDRRGAPALPATADSRGVGPHSMEYPASVSEGTIQLEHAIPHLTGRAPSGAIVQILDGSESIGSTVADADGNWAYPLDAPLSAGTHELMLRINGGQPTAPMRLVVEPEAVADSLHPRAEDHGIAQTGLHVSHDELHGQQADAQRQVEPVTPTVSLLVDLTQQDLAMDFSGLAMRLTQAEGTGPAAEGPSTERGLDALRLDGLLADSWAPVLDGGGQAESDVLLPLDEVAVHEALSQSAALSEVDSYGDLHIYSDVVLLEAEQPPHHTG